MWLEMMLGSGAPPRLSSRICRNSRCRYAKHSNSSLVWWSRMRKGRSSPTQFKALDVAPFASDCFNKESPISTAQLLSMH